jgi:hypothetical protein
MGFGGNTVSKSARISAIGEGYECGRLASRILFRLWYYPFDLRFGVVCDVPSSVLRLLPLLPERQGESDDRSDRLFDEEEFWFGAAGFPFRHCKLYLIV